MPGYAAAEVEQPDLSMWRGRIGENALALRRVGGDNLPGVPEYLLLGYNQEYLDQSGIDFQLFKAKFTGEILLDSEGFFGQSAVGGGIVMSEAELSQQIVVVEEMHMFGYARVHAEPVLRDYNTTFICYMYDDSVIYYMIQFGRADSVDDFNAFVGLARSNVNNLVVK